MNYFTKEQLEDITESILNNPVVETLKELYDKYSINKEEVSGNNDVPVSVGVPTPEVEVPEETSPVIQVDNPSAKNIGINVVPSIEDQYTSKNVMNNTSVNVLPPVENTPVVNPIPNSPLPAAPAVPLANEIVEPQVNIPVNNVSEVSSAPSSFNIPSFAVPEPPVNNIPVNTSVPNVQMPFTGSLWDAPQSEVNNLMQTTDNFGVSEQPVVNNNQMNAPFFGGPVEPVNNNQPVSEPTPNYGPTMFGQFEQSYRG